MKFIARYCRNLFDSIAVPAAMSRRHASLIRQLVRRELVSRNSGTLLGRIWPVLQPAIQMVGFWFLFDVIYGMRKISGPEFFEYLLTGLLPWFCLAELLSRATQMFRDFSSLYSRALFPVEILPVVIMVVPLMVYTLVYALVCFLIYGFTSALLSLIVIPLLLIWLFPLIYLFSVLGVFIRDFVQAMPLILMFCMYATPILYFPNMLPDWYQNHIWINPFADLMACIHAIVEVRLVPLDAVLRLSVIWLVLLAPSWIFFRRSLPHVREVL